MPRLCAERWTRNFCDLRTVRLVRWQREDYLNRADHLALGKRTKKSRRPCSTSAATFRMRRALAHVRRAPDS